MENLIILMTFWLQSKVLKLPQKLSEGSCLRLNGNSWLPCISRVVLVQNVKQGMRYFKCFLVVAELNFLMGYSFSYFYVAQNLK